MAHDPVVMFDTLGENLRKLKLVYMDCGDHVVIVNARKVRVTGAKSRSGS